MNRLIMFLIAVFVFPAAPEAARASGRDAPASGGTAAPRAQAASPFIGHMVTRKVHRRECEWAGKIPAADRIGFATWNEAKDAGYVACGKCKPEIAAAGTGGEETPLSTRTAGAPESTPAATPASVCIGNTVKKKAHRADCEWALKISEKNRAYFTTWGEAAAAGYTPCRVCNPDAPSSASPVPSAARQDEQSAGTNRPVSTDMPAAGEFCASSAGKTFHTPSCEWGRKISAKNLVIFKNRDAAIAAGKAPCKACTP